MVEHGLTSERRTVGMLRGAGRAWGAEFKAITLLDEAIAADHRRGVYPRVEVLGLRVPWQNLATARGSEAMNGYNPLRIGLYDQLVSPREQNWDVSQRQFPPSFANYDSPLAKALGLTYLVLGQLWSARRRWRRRLRPNCCSQGRRS